MCSQYFILVSKSFEKPRLCNMLFLYVTLYPSPNNSVIASILGQKTSFWCVSNQLIWTVPFDRERQMAERVRNHVRSMGKRERSSALAGAAAEPA